MLDAPGLDDAPLPGRRVPHNIEAEMALLGAILVNPQAYERVADFLRSEHFALAEHRRIFDGVRCLADQGRLADGVTMKSHLDNAGALDQVGGIAYLNQLIDCAVTPSNAGEYGRLVHELHIRRVVIADAQDVLNRAYDGADDLLGAVESLRSTIEGMSAGDRSGYLPFLGPGEVTLVKESWLVKRAIPKTGLTVIFGPSGSGKTFVTTDIVMATSRGDDWRGCRTERGAVLYLSPDGGGLFLNRIVAYCQHRGIDTSDHAVFTATCSIDLLASGDGSDTTKVLRTIAQIEAKHGVSVVAVVVDTASRAMPGGDENAAKDMTRLIDNLGRIGDGKRAVLVVHHSGKDLAQGMRGHSALHAAADCVLKVHDGQIDIVKSRDGASGLAGGFGLKVVELGMDEDGEPVTSCVAVAADVAQRHAKGTTLTHADRVALRTITNLIAEHGEPLPQGTGFPTGGRHRGVTSALVTTSLRGSIFADKRPDAARQAAGRIRTKLQDLGMIGAAGGYVWLAPGNDMRDSDSSRADSPGRTPGTGYAAETPGRRGFCRS